MVLTTPLNTPRVRRVCARAGKSLSSCKAGRRGARVRARGARTSSSAPPTYMGGRDARAPRAASAGGGLFLELREQRLADGAENFRRRAVGRGHDDRLARVAAG